MFCLGAEYTINCKYLVKVFVCFLHKQPHFRCQCGQIQSCITNSSLCFQHFITGKTKTCFELHFLLIVNSFISSCRHTDTVESPPHYDELLYLHFSGIYDKLTACKPIMSFFKQTVGGKYIPKAANE